MPNLSSIAVLRLTGAGKLSRTPLTSILLLLDMPLSLGTALSGTQSDGNLISGMKVSSAKLLNSPATFDCREGPFSNIMFGLRSSINTILFLLCTLQALR